MNIPEQPVYYVVFVLTGYKSFDEARAKAADLLAAHIERSKELHARGVVLMSGAFLNDPKQPLGTMAVCPTREAAEEYITGDPFVQKGLVRSWFIREWANMFA
jgi:uncharacterized protein YciI